MPRFAFFGGEFVPIEQAQVSIMTHAFNYGTGCFEGIRAYYRPAL
jgi:branched-chain amino acid aminotransferase